MQAEYFSLMKKKIIIYAAGSIGRRVLNVCQKNYLTVMGFIDVRADEIKAYQNHKVYSLEQVAVFEEKNEYAVVITVRNVFEHSKVAEQLMQLGFCNLIYKPYTVLLGQRNSKENSIFEAHEALTERSELFWGEIACSLYEENAERRTWFIEERDKKIKCYIPVELLFTNKKKNTIYNGINLMMIHPLIPLFRAFDSGDVEELHRATDRYVNGFAKIGAQGININTEGRWEQGVLKGRKQVFAEMSAMQALSKTFFSDYCPDVEWEKDMRFSLISSGKSRVSFLVARNIAYVPVWMDKKEWNDFYHEDAVKKIHDYLKKNGFAELFAPLPHPAFMHMTYKCYDFQFLWLEKSGRYLAEYIFEQTKGFYFEKYSALYAMEDLGITERLYASQGLHSYRYGEIGELEKLCDGLFYYKPEIYLGREVDFSYVSMKYREKIKDILINTTEICFLLDDRDEMETKREIEDCGFTIKTVLFAAYWSDKEVHGIVLQRERIDGKNAGN